MKITKIEFENFRNFKEHGSFECAIDGKVTIVYGENGDGKTTLQQLIHWVFYGNVIFNKTTDENILWNEKFFAELDKFKTFDVWGKIDFIHDDKRYSLKRKNTYKKVSNTNAEDLSKIFELTTEDGNGNWKSILQPKRYVEEFLPEGLSTYFFFDGEGMITELREKSSHSAKALEKAINYLCELDSIKSAIDHIGKTSTKTSVLGELSLDNGGQFQTGDLGKLKRQMETLQGEIFDLNKKIKVAEDSISDIEEKIRHCSEEIGARSSSENYNKWREETQRDIADLEKQLVEKRESYGILLVRKYVNILVGSAFVERNDKISASSMEANVPTGVKTELLHGLLNSSSKKCICGHDIEKEEREELEKLLAILDEYDAIPHYNSFAEKMTGWKNAFEGSNELDSFLEDYLDLQDKIEKKEKRIAELDEEEAKQGNVDGLIKERQRYEQNKSELEKELKNYIGECATKEKLFEAAKRKHDSLVTDVAAKERIERSISIMTEVKGRLQKILAEKAVEYSQSLQKNIQALLDVMLTTKRNVEVSKEFKVRVTGQYGDESKSEGQFAVVSFAYIGGILKMLKSDKAIKVKEYPLILDGPFSKLDAKQRNNVINNIPLFASQVIIFSKDPIDDVLAEEKIGKIYTLEANAHKNETTIREGTPSWR